MTTTAALNTATRHTTPFIHFKAMVCEEVGCTVAALEQHARRLGAAFDMGEPVWMVAEEMKLRLSAPAPAKTPRQLAVAVHFVTDEFVGR